MTTVAKDHRSIGADGASSVGERLRLLRLRQGLTLKAVATTCGLSESFLSQLERGRVNASIASLQRIASALGTGLAELFEPAEATGPQLVRADERPSLVYGVLGRKHLVTPPLEHLEVFLGTFEAGGSTGAEPYSHGDSDELFVVLRGSFELEVGAARFVLAEGDAVNYRSSSPHRAAYLGDDVGEVMWIVSPPSL